MRRSYPHRCDVGRLSDDPCAHTATHYTEQWGRGSPDYQLCETHAKECRSDGWDVTDLVTGEPAFVYADDE